MNMTMAFRKRFALPLALTIAALCCLPGWSKLQAQSSGLQVYLAVPSSGRFQLPLDAALDPDGSTIYFTAIGPNGPGVFRVPGAGGTVAEVMAGYPFVAPIGLVISTDSQRIYVADPQAWNNGGRPGQIFVLSIRGGPSVTFRGAEGTGPRDLEVVSEGGRDMIYFTGTDPRTGEVGVFKLPATGAALPTVLAEGAPFVDPHAVTVARTGAVYVTDKAAAGGNVGSVFKIEDSRVTKLIDMVRTGHPAGVALSLDETVLLVSALQPYSDHDQLLLLRLDTLQTESFTQVIGQNRNSSGGLHRARNRDMFVWVDRNGTIFCITAR